MALVGLATATGIIYINEGFLGDRICSSLQYPNALASVPGGGDFYRDGSQIRDFTCVDDIARGTVLSLKPAGCEIINLGNNSLNKLSEAIQLIEKYTGKKAELKYSDFHKADITATWADISKANVILKWRPRVSFEEGIEKTVRWSRENWNWIQNVNLV